MENVQSAKARIVTAKNAHSGKTNRVNAMSAIVREVNDKKTTETVPRCPPLEHRNATP